MKYIIAHVFLSLVAHQWRSLGIAIVILMFLSEVLTHAQLQNLMGILFFLVLFIGLMNRHQKEKEDLD
ncbi:MAG: hypothetical protein LC778_10400 [Acidobacteria bacterium]|nr:hypothetical protein [Acidobacteriota bacterium]